MTGTVTNQGSEVQTAGTAKRKDGSIRVLFIHEGDEEVLRVYFDKDNNLVDRWQDAYTSDELESLKGVGVDIDDNAINERLMINNRIFKETDFSHIVNQ